MRKLILIVAAAAAVFAGVAHAVTLVDRIVAVVNKDVVTYSELNEAVGMAERQLRRQGTPAPERAVLERQTLERLILDKAQLQLARETGIRIDELQLDRAVERIAQSNNMTLADFRRALEGDGVAFDAWRNEVRQQMILTRLREREVENRVQVSDTEVDLFLEQLKNHPDEGAEYNIAHILVRVPEGASPERIRQARSRAEQAGAEVRSGAPFARVAAGYSDAPDALQGGALGWRNHERLPELFADALAKMKPGDISEPLRSPAGFHIVQLIERRGTGAQAPVVQTRMRHILIRTNEAVSESEARRKLLDLRERIVSGGADFAELARVHSDDGTAARGGELDWVYPGDTVPEFERAYEELKIGELSQPVRTPSGCPRIEHVPLARPAVPGRLDPGNARYVLAVLDRAIRGCLEGEFAAMVTAPVQKSLINDAGIAFTGHTEYLAEKSGAAQVVMMLVGGGLRVALATTHLPLAEVPRAITTNGVSAALWVIDADLKRRFRIARPRILVAGLNPHSGESGHLGREDMEVIAPAIAAARAGGIDAKGPIPADTLFVPERVRQADAVLAMYHDQGLPVLKYASFGRGVNITLGLPFIRTSVDHGTALDLAGTGRADSTSLAEALKLAVELASSA